MKKILLDTSVLVAAMVESHPEHSKAFPYLRDARRGRFNGIIAAHTLAELYAVLTSLPVQPRIGAEAAGRLIEENLLGLFSVIVLSKSDYISIIKRLSERHVTGGATYDALIAHAAYKAGVDKLVTFNVEDFMRVCPEKLTSVISAV